MSDGVLVPDGLAVEPRHWAIVERILRQHIPEREVWAFGSRVNGRPKPHSDLDLVVLGDEPLSIAQQARLAEAFSESDLPWRVDLLDWASTSDAFRALITARQITVQAATS